MALTIGPPSEFCEFWANRVVDQDVDSEREKNNGNRAPNVSGKPPFLFAKRFEHFLWKKPTYHGCA